MVRVGCRLASWRCGSYFRNNCFAAERVADERVAGESVVVGRSAGESEIEERVGIAVGAGVAGVADFRVKNCQVEWSEYGNRYG